MYDQEQGCLLCHAPLIYQEEAKKKTCVLCHKPFSANVWCEQGHFICDECHRSPAVAAITAACLQAAKEKKNDPILLAKELMRLPAVQVHGPEHHFLVPAVLLTVCKNAGFPELDVDKALSAAKERASQVPGGACGFFGACGGCVGAGIFVSVLLGATPLASETFGLANRMTSLALGLLSRTGGPRCCKRSVFYSISAAALFANRQLGASLPLPQRISCGFSGKNLECKKERCPFNRGISLDTLEKAALPEHLSFDPDFF